MPDIIPQDITRILSRHGPVQLSVGPAGAQVSSKCHLAPFEDFLFFFVRKSSPIREQLMRHTGAQVYLQAEDQSYQILLTGRATAGLPLRGHERRMELVPWLPDGMQSCMVVPFFCEEVEFHDRRKELHRTFTGKTLLGQQAPEILQRWALAALDGGRILMAVCVMVVWGWLLTRGADYPLRWVGLTLGSLSIIFLQAGYRLWSRSEAFHRAEKHPAFMKQSGILSEGLLAPKPARHMGWILTLLGLILCGSLVMWPGSLAPAVFFISLSWLLWPNRILQFLSPEPKR